MTDATFRPLILIDVDGVLNIWRGEPFARKKRQEGWVQERGFPQGSQRGFPLLLNPLHGRWLLQLAQDTGAELAWGTTWERDANSQVGRHIGLPELPVAPIGRHGKASGVVPWTSGRPFVWFDDDRFVSSDCAALAGIQKHLVVSVDERSGLTEEHISEARKWLIRLREQSLGMSPEMPDESFIPDE